jgi:hypothetical protein
MAFLKVDPLTFLFHRHLSGFNCGFVCIAEIEAEKVTIFFREIDLFWLGDVAMQMPCDAERLNSYWH